jgi:electron transfer flavoprotein beta subunit
MKVLVAIKRVVDANIPVRVKQDGSGVDLASVKMAINPFDEIAIEEAVRLREQGIASEVIVTTVGASVAIDILRTALALGADRALLCEHEGRLEPLAIAKLLKVVADHEKPDLVILGKQAIDDDANQTGQMLAALMGRPQGTFASKIVLEDGFATVTREVDLGLETIKLELPAVVTTDLRLNQPRYASLPNIMKAKKKPVETRKAADMGVSLETLTNVVSVRAPHQRQSGKRIESVAEFASALRKEAGLA